MPYAAPKKQTSRQSVAAASMSGEVAAATWASEPPPPQPQLFLNSGVSYHPRFARASKRTLVRNKFCTFCMENN